MAVTKEEESELVPRIKRISLITFGIAYITTILTVISYVGWGTNAAPLILFGSTFGIPILFVVLTVIIIVITGVATWAWNGEWDPFVLPEYLDGLFKS